MKKMLTIFVCLVLICSLAACGKREDADSQFSNPLSNESVPEFSTKNLQNEKITNEIFKDHNVTLLNLWASWCEPCVDEMPHFQKLYETYKDKGINIIGLVADEKLDSSSLQETKNVVEKVKAKYPILIADKNLYSSIVSKFDYIPVTLLVDKDGKILEQFIPGSTDYEGLETLIKDYVSK